MIWYRLKPTGQGTGLGLSLAYDIVKAQGGQLKVHSKEGEGVPAGKAGTEFVIFLPILRHKGASYMGRAYSTFSQFLVYTTD